MEPVSGRGLGNACVDDRRTHRGLLPTQPFPVPSVQASAQSPLLDLRTAAASLGRIYRQLERLNRELGTEKLGEWAVPGPSLLVSGDREMNPQLSRATESVFGAGSSEVTRIRTYDALYEAVMPDVQSSAVGWGTKILSLEASLLEALRRDTAAPGFAAWMHQTAEDIVTGSVACRIGAAERYRADLVKMGFPPAESPEVRVGLPSPQMDVGRESCLFESARTVLKSEKLSGNSVPRTPGSPEERKRYVEMVEVLASAGKTNIRDLPTFAEIIEAYAQSGSEGTRRVHELISTAAGAVNSFSTMIASHPSRVWRYAVLIIGGVRELGLYDVDGFREYALGIGGVLGERTPARLVNHLGMGLLVIGLMSTGIGVGLAALDFATAGASAYFNYVREREQEIAVKASVFLPDERKFASDFGYGSTGMSLAFTLLAAVSLSGALLRRWWPVPDNPLAPTAARMRTPGGPAKAAPKSPRLHRSDRGRGVVSPTTSSPNRNGRDRGNPTRSRYGKRRAGCLRLPRPRARKSTARASVLRRRAPKPRAPRRARPVGIRRAASRRRRKSPLGSPKMCPRPLRTTRGT